MPSVEVVLSPGLYPFRILKSDPIVVIVDVFRATTTICSALYHGVESVAPVSDSGELLTYAKKGYFTAGERNGVKLEFTDFGNSPLEFRDPSIRGRKLAISTTNGTQAIEKINSVTIVAGAFVNLDLLTRWLTKRGKDVIIYCAGQAGNIIMEDTIFAGALVSYLNKREKYKIAGDPALASVRLWMSAKSDLKGSLSSGSHFNRLKDLGYQDDIDFCLTLDKTPVVPVLNEGEFTAAFQEV
jgi:2-phosphosulfolactate phosphatase